MAPVFDIINSELVQVDNYVAKEFKIKAGNVTEFAHLNVTPLEKELHPGLLLLSAHLFNFDREKALALAGVIQFIYLASSIHFGVSDRDSDFRENMADVKDGSQLPVLVGDYLYGKFFTTLAKHDILGYLKPLAEIIAEMNLGGILRKKLISQDQIHESEVINIIKKETAELFAGSCRLGASIAGAGEADAQNMSEFGINLGMAYGLLERGFEHKQVISYLENAREKLDKYPDSPYKDALLRLLDGIRQRKIEVPSRRIGESDNYGRVRVGDMTLPQEYKNREDFVLDTFNQIARKYDILNTILSFNRDKYWRKVTVESSGVKPGSHVLDVCCGTGLITLEHAKIVGDEGKVTGLDFSEGMLDVARENIKKTKYFKNIELVQGNATNLPFSDNTFDCATVGFGLRNIPNMTKAIKEMMRVVKPGGKIVCLEFSKPTLPVFREIYEFYFFKILPFLGKLGVGKDSPYRYLPNSWKTFPCQKELKEIFTKLGLKDTYYKELTFGIASVHVGTK